MTDNEIKKLLNAISALMRSVERLLMTDNTDGVGDAMVTNYTKLHSRIAEAYPDDYYVTDVLMLDIPADATDKQKVTLVQLAVTQMETYLQTLLEEEADEVEWDGFGPPPPGWSPLEDRRFRKKWKRKRSREERDFGAELSDEILNFTKETLRRALGSIDIIIDENTPEPPTPPTPPKPKHKPPVEPDDDVL